MSNRGLSTWAQLLTVAVVLLALAGGLAIADWRQHREPRLVGIGTPAPNFHVQAIGSERPADIRTLAQYQGDVVVLNVWATWCGPCRIEMPSLERLYLAFAARGLRVVAISVDDDGHDADIQAFVRQYGLTFDVLHDGSGRLETLYQTGGVPETFVIARDGVIRKRVMGAEDWASRGNETLIARLLDEPPTLQARTRAPT
jgi:cytochrome c biogenesis protein CcmG, thiol:disulfide interchange protein DsbE